MKSIRVGIDVRWMHDGLTHKPDVEMLGGIGNYVRNVAVGLAAARPDWTFVLFHSPDRSLERLAAEFIDTPNVEYVAFPPDRRRGAVAAVSRYFHRYAYPSTHAIADAAHLNIYHSTSQFQPAFGRRHAQVITVHDAIGAISGQMFIRQHYWRRLLRQYTKYDAVITDSENTRRDLMGLSAGSDTRLHAIPLAVDSAFGEYDRGAAWARVSARYQIRGPFLLYVGGLQPTKNVARLIQAYAAFAQGLPSAPCLVIAGADPELYPRHYQRVRQMIAACEISQQTHLLPFVPKSDLIDLYTSALAFVFPSLYEGFGLPPLEAMTCGLPVVCSTRGSLAEVVGDAAYCVDPENLDSIRDGIDRIVRDAALRRKLGAAGLERARRFSWSAVIAAHIALFEAVLTSRGR